MTDESNTDKNCSSSVLIIVQTVEWNIVRVSPYSLTFYTLGDTKKLTVDVVDENGNVDSTAVIYLGSYFNPPILIEIKEMTGGLDITAIVLGQIDLRIF